MRVTEVTEHSPLEVASVVARLIERAPAGGIFNEVAIGLVDTTKDGADFRVDLGNDQAFVVTVTPLSSTRPMKTWEVNGHLGSGGDTDSIGTYLVYAEDEQDAEDTARGNSRHLINATANLIRNPGAVDEMDYDGVLMSEKGGRAWEKSPFREDENAHERMTGQHDDSEPLDEVTLAYEFDDQSTGRTTIESQ